MDEHKPQPMTPEMRASLGGVVFEEERFMYGNWLGSWQWYMQKWPGFTEGDCRVLELYSNGVMAKEHKQLLKKKQRKKCSASGPGANSR